MLRPMRKGGLMYGLGDELQHLRRKLWVYRYCSAIMLVVLILGRRTCM